MIDKLRASPWARRAGYPLFFSVVFYGALYVGLPYDAARDRIVAEARDQLGLKLSIGKVRLAGLTGVTLTDVVIHTGDEPVAATSVVDEAKEREEKEREEKERAAKEHHEKESAADEEAKKKEAELAKTYEGDAQKKELLEKEAKEREAKEKESVEARKQEEAKEVEVVATGGGIHIDSLTLKAELFALLRGKQAFSFDASAWGGRLRGRVDPGETLVIRARASGFDLARSPLKSVSGLDLVGKLATLDLDLTAEKGDFSKADGELLIKGEDLVLNGGEIQHFELPRVVLGTLDGKIAIKEGKADVDSFGLEGQDVAAKVQATLRLSPQILASTINGKVLLKPSDDWWNRNELLKTAANFALPAGSDGWRSVNVYGQLQHVSFRP
ncbi:type II secretion system protein GspN [Vulgatibacter incomptus]|uniref:type II secretion system protein GspN n=1 Tax=Vulgatibacter incomptus TaxID=1391653 RepID=UPI0014706E34|nr:type II secretion system protein GspN [Vulgatibacter incomptus]